MEQSPSSTCTVLPSLMYYNNLCCLLLFVSMQPGRQLIGKPLLSHHASTKSLWAVCVFNSCVLTTEQLTSAFSKLPEESMYIKSQTACSQIAEVTQACW